MGPAWLPVFIRKATASPVTLVIAETPGGLSIHARKTLTVIRLVLGLAQGAFAGFLVHGAAGYLLDKNAAYFSGIVSALAVAIVAYLAVAPEERWRLLVNAASFESHGVAGEDGDAHRSVRVSKVKWLEYQYGEGKGLYAVLSLQTVCLLPGIEEQQAFQIIDHIERKFPEHAERWRKASPFGKHHIRLGLTDDA